MLIKLFLILAEPGRTEFSNEAEGAEVIGDPVHSDSNIDIADLVGLGTKLNNFEKVEKLNFLWTPDEDFIFPSQAAKTFTRHFQRKWFDEFKWLAYSKKESGLYCATCVLFLNTEEVGKGSHEKPQAFVTRSFYNVKKSVASFKNHESHTYHKNAALAQSHVKALVGKRQESVIALIDTVRKKEVQENRLRLNGIIETVKLCGMQNIPLRGRRDSGRISLSSPVENDGNFRSLIRFRANAGDTVLKDHILHSPLNAMYVSPEIQNELIETIGSLIRKDIIKRISQSKYFTILADETTDISQIEQFSLCARYVSESENGPVLMEDFLTFVPVSDVTGEGLARVIEEKLTTLGLDLENVRGQGYDGASAMSGQFRGVQAVLKRKYPKALYTHCVSHCLNLCLSDSFKVQNVRNTMGLITETCSFFRASAKRTAILEEKIKELSPSSDHHRIKTLCETRWCERHEAVLLFKEMLVPIVSTLEKMAYLPNEHNKRSSLVLNSISSSSFLVSLVVSSKLLGITYSLSQYLQKKDIDLCSALDHVRKVKAVVEDLRHNADSEFKKLFEEAKELANLLQLELTMPRIATAQKNRQNPPAANPEDYFRISIFIPCIDDLISGLSERFLAHEAIIASLQYLIPSHCDVDFDKVKPSFEFYKDDLHSGFTEAHSGEWSLWRERWKNDTGKPKTAIDALAQCDKELFPNMYTLFTIFAVIPVSTASVERSFSKLKLLKNYLRNTMGETRLTGLALMSVHRDIVIGMSNEDIVNMFASSGRARRFKLL